MTRVGILEHKEVFNKWLDGAEIQFLSKSNEWIDLKNPKWYTGFKYRVKPTKIEFKDCSFNDEEYCVDSFGRIIAPETASFNIEKRTDFIKDKEIAEAYAVLPQLIRLRDEYNEGWKPDWKDNHIKYVLDCWEDVIVTARGNRLKRLLSFKTEEIRDKFLKNHRDLIEIAKPFL